MAGLPEMIEVGQVGRPHGIMGAMRLYLHDPTSDSMDAVPADRLRLEHKGCSLSGVSMVGRGDKFVIITVSGVSSRDEAARLRGCPLTIPRECVDLESDEFLYTDLIDCEVWEGQTPYGRVREVFSAGASDILAIDDGEHERLIPLVDPWVVAIDLDAGRIEVSGGEQFEAQPSSSKKWT